MAPFYEPGKYRVLVLEQAWDKAQSGADQLVLKFRVNAKIEDDGSGETYEAVLSHNYERRIFLTFTENSIDYIVKKLRYAGFTGSSFEELSLAGAELVAECKHEARDNQQREKWDLPWAMASAPLKSDSSIARKVNTLFGRALKSGASAGAAVAATTAQRPLAAAVPGGAPRVPDDDEGIPFAATRI